MTSKRSDLAVVVHNGKVYAIGGFTGEVSLVLFYFFLVDFFSFYPKFIWWTNWLWRILNRISWYFTLRSKGQLNVFIFSKEFLYFIWLVKYTEYNVYRRFWAAWRCMSQVAAAGASWPTSPPGGQGCRLWSWRAGYTSLADSTARRGKLIWLFWTWRKIT